MRLIIENTQQALVGKIRINGSKNSSLAIITACVLSKQTIILKNIPYITDTIVLVQILKSMGAHAEFQKSDFDGNHTLEINCSTIFTSSVPTELASRIRASVLLLGPLVGRFGMADTGVPGGCKLGKRALDFHEMGFELLGASMEIGATTIHVKTKSNQLRGNVIKFPFSSVGATENILMASVLAEGITVIQNASIEPEISDLANFLNLMGAKIKGIGTTELSVIGVKELCSTCEYRIIPDRHEAGTFALAGILTHGELELIGIQIDDIKPILHYLRILGAKITNNSKSNSISIIGSKDIINKKPLEITTETYPGFPTDMQPQLCVALSLTVGNQSHSVAETIFEHRFSCVSELKKMGARVEMITKQHARIFGVSKLNSAILYGSDLRATAALVLAGLVANGDSPTVVENADAFFRGYEHFHSKLNACGASIRIE